MDQQELRRYQAAFIDRLERAGAIRSPWMKIALERSPRHSFIRTIVPRKKHDIEDVDPESPSKEHLEAIYSDEVVTIRESPSYSSSSQPSLMLAMLYDLDVSREARILEIGTGTGWNASLLAVGNGRDDLVFSMDNQADLVSIAKDSLVQEGFPGVNLKTGDGIAGWPEASPFDRIIATAASKDIYQAWLRQMAEGGILLIPFRIGTLADPILKIEKREGMFSGKFTRWSAFTELKVGAQERLSAMKQPEFAELAERLQALSHESGTVPLSASANEDWWHYFADLQFFLHLNGLNFHQGWLGTNSLYICHEARAVMAYNQKQQVLRLFGDDAACADLRHLILEWEEMGSPGIEKFGVRVVPPQIAAKGAGEWIERGAETSLLVSLIGGGSQA